ncbi:YoaK family protein, partial [Ideonella sp.]|uniref:YoaK family protein n=1 Tax=Ideonella sp. TaxID=1929293 RepID=UPI003BB6FB9D
LAFVAGAINAGGFLAVQQYTSHMTGLVSTMADDLVLGAYDLVLNAAGGLISFLLGAACSALMVNVARRRQLHSEYALPLLLEAALLLCFGMLGARLSQIEGLFVPLTVMLLCFIMGLQNAVITKLSHAEIRTTHLTGVITDIGIELGKLMVWNGADTPASERVTANFSRLRILGSIAGSFFAGGLIGALGFKHLGYVSTVPLAVLLVALALLPAVDDFKQMLVRRTKR